MSRTPNSKYHHWLVKSTVLATVRDMGNPEAPEFSDAMALNTLVTGDDQRLTMSRLTEIQQGINIAAIQKVGGPDNITIHDITVDNMMYLGFMTPAEFDDREAAAAAKAKALQEQLSQQAAGEDSKPLIN